MVKIFWILLLASTLISSCGEKTKNQDESVEAAEKKEENIEIDKNVADESEDVSEVPEKEASAQDDFMEEEPLEIDEAALSLFEASPGISKGYKRPFGKQGAGHYRDTGSLESLNKRNRVITGMGIKFRQLNLFWNPLESSNSGEAYPASSANANLKCPADARRVPFNLAEKNSRKYNKFRCFNKAEILRLDRVIKSATNNGMQVGAVLWNAPALYRHPNCKPEPFAGRTLGEGCAPRQDAEEDWQDFVNFVSRRYSGDQGKGRLQHYVVWNENAANLWFNLTPEIDAPGADKLAIRVKRYANLMRRAHTAIGRWQRSAMLYASIDHVWSQSAAKKVSGGHVGTKSFMDGLWSELKLSIDWSVAAHLYGPTSGPVPEGIFSFANVDVITNYQKAKLASFGKTDHMAHPQAFIIANEQGVPLTAAEVGTPQGIARKTKFICEAHLASIANPQLIFQAHNYFQSNGEEASGTSGQGAFYGLIPHSVGSELQRWNNSVEAKAFLATDPRYFGRYDNHVCCTKHKLGCGSTTLIRSRSDAGDHIADISVPAGYKRENVLGRVLLFHGKNHHPVYLCKTSKGDHFLWKNKNCGSHTTIKLMGFLRTKAANGYKQVFLCKTLDGKSQFVSFDQHCEGQSKLTSLGYSALKQRNVNVKLSN